MIALPGYKIALISCTKWQVHTCTMRKKVPFGKLEHIHVLHVCINYMYLLRFLFHAQEHLYITLSSIYIMLVSHVYMHVTYTWCS